VHEPVERRVFRAPDGGSDVTPGPGRAESGDGGVPGTGSASTGEEAAAKHSFSREKRTGPAQLASSTSSSSSSVTDVRLYKSADW